MTFNHNDLGQANGNFFALPRKEKDDEGIEIISVPWDATTSYRPGTSKAPQAVLAASLQVDIFDSDVEKAWEMKISNTELDLCGLNSKCRHFAEKIIQHLENGGSTTDMEIADMLNFVNRSSETVNSTVYENAKKILSGNKTAAVLGGDHSTPFGLIKAVAEKYPKTGILHIDAHADLRGAFEGFTYSHASIMYNVMTEIEGIEKLVQVGVRDFCEAERDFAGADNRICMYADSCLKENRFAGKTWKEQCDEIISHLPEHVYISFDVDGLSPYLCPNTGTPVPGGLDFAEAMYLIKQTAFSGRIIAGFDLNEVSPGISGDWDANVGARILFKLCCYAWYSNKYHINKNQ
ncbi:MAG: agmatinase family protein [Prevotellaceae bacterium]|jgi:agmatinase|nr:agmatinase family protein [Prevotellaceae bacterium]